MDIKSTTIRSWFVRHFSETHKFWTHEVNKEFSIVYSHYERYSFTFFIVKNYFLQNERNERNSDSNCGLLNKNNYWKNFSIR